MFMFCVVLLTIGSKLGSDQIRNEGAKIGLNFLCGHESWLIRQFVWTSTSKKTRMHDFCTCQPPFCLLLFSTTVSYFFPIANLIQRQLLAQRCLSLFSSVQFESSNFHCDLDIMRFDANYPIFIRWFLNLFGFLLMIFLLLHSTDSTVDVFFFATAQHWNQIISAIYEKKKWKPIFFKQQPWIESPYELAFIIFLWSNSNGDLL